MSKAEERSLEAFPDYKMFDGRYMTQKNERSAYISGYHQAEKDLALTWENMNDIIRIYEDVIETESGENIYIKVLKRFKEMKK